MQRSSVYSGSKQAWDALVSVAYKTQVRFDSIRLEQELQRRLIQAGYSTGSGVDVCAKGSRVQVSYPTDTWEGKHLSQNTIAEFLAGIENDTLEALRLRESLELLEEATDA